MNRPRPCLDCGVIQTHGTRCADHYREWHRRRNQDPKRRALYGGTWAATSRAARKAQPQCSVCGATDNLQLDHEHNQVECRDCNLEHRRFT